ncbi:MAG: D-TA family PLP-dependent enzyme [Planctomycetaceae bacterium]
MDSCYQIADTSEIISPAIVIFAELLDENLDRMIAIAGSPSRLRPHCKTHKMAEVTRREQAKGITKHKCATFAEAEMLARAGVRDVVLAYNIVGPNIARAVRFLEQFSDVQFAVTADHPGPIGALGRAVSAAGKTISVLLDIDTGQHRTGIVAGDEARKLYRLIAETPGLIPGGFHVYDGHQHQKSREERAAAVNAEWAKVVAFRDQIVADGLPVPRLVCGGTASFPIYAEKYDPTIELSPGTCVFHDSGYAAHFPDMVFRTAALLLTRVISRPTANRVTLDLGNKAVASDPPAGSRVVFPDLPDAKQVIHNEEHLVIETSRAEEFQPGDELLAIPIHICPTSALHKEVFVISGGKLVDRWEVTARDRRLTV